MKNLKSFENAINETVHGSMSPHQAYPVVLSALNGDDVFLQKIRHNMKIDPERAMKDFINDRVNFIRHYVVYSNCRDEVDFSDIRFVLVDNEESPVVRHIPMPNAFDENQSGVIAVNVNKFKTVSLVKLAYLLEKELVRANITQEKLAGFRAPKSFSADSLEDNQAIGRLYGIAYNCNEEEFTCNYEASIRIESLICCAIDKYGKCKHLKDALKEVKGLDKKFMSDYNKSVWAGPVASLVVKLKERSYHKEMETEYFKSNNFDQRLADDDEYDFIERKIRIYAGNPNSSMPELDEKGNFVKGYGTDQYKRYRTEMAKYMLAYASERLGINMNDTMVYGFSDVVDKVTFVDYKKLPENKLSRINKVMLLPENYAKLSQRDFVNSVFGDFYEIFKLNNSEDQSE